MSTNETKQHLFAKEVLRTTETIVVPEVIGKSWQWHEGTKIYPDRTLKVLDVQIEPHLGSFRPDAILETDAGQIIVEVWVTSSVSESKQYKIKQYDHPAIEIDLRDTDDLSTVRDLVINSKESKTWIFHPAIEPFHALTQERSHSISTVYHGVAWHTEDCPEQMRDWNGKVYANVLDDCVYCASCCGIPDEDEDSQAIKCLGKNGTDTLAQIVSEIKETFHSQ